MSKECRRRNFSLFMWVFNWQGGHPILIQKQGVLSLRSKHWIWDMAWVIRLHCLRKGGFVRLPYSGLAWFAFTLEKFS